MTLNPGTRLGPYEIVAPLGAGGMGEVYRARDTRLGRDVAVKVLPQHLSSNPEVRARFEREAKTVSSLNHPNICTLFDIGREGDTDYLVMELVDGETLASRLARGPLPATEMLRIGVQVADALVRAHRAGVIHRDLKPGNIMLTKSGAKLMDFGLARATGLGGSSGSVSDSALTRSPTIAQPLTAEGTIVGTFQYMAPEQLEGKDADVRSDIWSLGCVLYEMATGKRAFEGRSQASLIAAILEHEPAPIVEVQPMAPAALDRLVRAMLAKDPDDRVQTAQDAKLQLEWMQGETASSSVASPAPGTPRSRRFARARWAWIAVPVLAAAAAFLAGRASAPQGAYQPLQFARKTWRDQSIFSARFLPDGKTLVLSASLGGNVPRIYVIRPEYPEPQPVSDAPMHLLAVSRRGELLVLNRARYSGHHRLFKGTLARMPLEGAAPRDIMEDVREADWSPDGDNVAIIHEMEGKDRLEFPVGTVLHESGGYLSDVRVSPDGHAVAFMAHPAKYDDRGSVYVVDTNGTAREISGGYWGMEGMAWAPDGKSVLFSATDNGSDYVVHEFDLKGRERPTRQNVGLVTIHDIAADGTWAVTRDDLPVRMAFRAAGSSDEVDVSWLDSGLLPILSTDAKTLAFTDQSIEAGPNYAVTLRPSTGGSIVRLGEGAATQFSPDGKSMLAIVYSTPPKLVSYPVGAGQAVRLDHGGLENITAAQWMPDAKHVILSGNEPGRPARCFLLDVATGNREPVGPEGLWEPYASPDGRQFIARAQTGWTLVPVGRDGDPQPVPMMTPGDYVFRWNLDGTAVYAFHRGQVPSNVDRVDVATGARESVMTVCDAKTPGVVGVIGVSLADDLQSVAYATWHYSSVLYTVGSAR